MQGTLDLSPRARLVALVARQTEMFNTNAPVEERVEILNQIRKVRKEMQDGY